MATITDQTTASSTPPSGAEDVRQPLMSTILDLIERGESREVGVILESRSIAEQLKRIAWDLVPQVCGYLTHDVLRDKPEVIDAAGTVLTQLAVKAKPKEVLLVLLEQADMFKDDVKFITLLPAIQTCLLQLPAKRGHSIAIAAETLYSHLATLTIPEHQALDGEERKLLEQDEDVARVNDVTRALIDFLEPLAEQITYRENGTYGKIKDTSEQKELIRCILKVMNHPLAFMDTMHRGEKVKTNSRLNAERLMVVLSLVQPDYIKLLNNIMEENFQIDQQKELHAKKRKEAVERGDIPDDIDDYDVQEKYPELSVAVLAYLVFGEELGFEKLPRVYTSQYIFESILTYASQLLNSTDIFTVEKGVRLLRGSLERLADCSMSAEILEWEEIGCTVGHLIQVMTQSQCKDTCREAVQILPLWLSKFDSVGRHKSFFFILMKEPHSGLVGYAIQLLKNEVDAALRMIPHDEYFVGAPLEKLLELVFTLPHGSQTDLLDQSDRVMAALNLLRYLILRDKPANNVTGIWTYLPRVEKHFCEPLRSGLDMSRAHYQLEIKKAGEGTSELINRQKNSPDMSFSVGGKSLPQLTPEQEREVMLTALHTFDMMQSVLGRIEEVITQQRREGDSNL